MNDDAVRALLGGLYAEPLAPPQTPVRLDANRAGGVKQLKIIAPKQGGIARGKRVVRARVVSKVPAIGRAAAREKKDSGAYVL